VELVPARWLGVRARRATSANAIVKSLGGSALTWWLLPSDGSPAAFLHRAYREETWEEAGALGRAALCAGWLLGIPVAIVLVGVLTVRLGGGAARRAGKGRLRQAAEELVLALRFSIPPLWYYSFELWDDARRARALEYLYRFETKTRTGIYPFLRTWLTSGGTTDALRDKAAFALHCQAHGVAVVAALATAVAGRITRLDGGGSGLPATDLFVKPISGAGGRGAARWLHRDDGTFESQDGEVLSEARLIERIEQRSQAESLVLRKCVSNHPDLRELGAGALSTLRVVSCIDERGGIEVTHAVLRMSIATDAIVDNFHAGGIAAKVDLDSGILGRATNMGVGRDAGWWESHPITGARILGRAVPAWQEVLALARRAHATFPDQVAIGWDIAVLPDGPALVEGNKSPDLDIVQRTHREPVGNSRLGEMLAFHVARALERKRAARGHGSPAVARAAARPSAEADA
jgi:hypothetical protein